MSGKAERTSISIALLVLRLVFGGLIAAHGWQKTFVFTFDGTAASFADMGVPFATVVGPAVALLELVGGILLIAGLLTRVVAALLTVDMLVALLLVHVQQGVFVADGGFELVAALGAGTLALALAGGGAYALDRVVSVGRRKA